MESIPELEEARGRGCDVEMVSQSDDIPTEKGLSSEEIMFRSKEMAKHFVNIVCKREETSFLVSRDSDEKRDGKNDNNTSDKACEKGAEGKKVIYRVKEYKKFLDEGGRRFIYLTSVGKGYHNRADFESQLRVIIDLISAQLICDRAKFSSSFSQRGPFEVTILFADSLQAYSLEEDEGRIKCEDINFDQKTKGQCLRLKKQDPYLKRAVSTGEDLWGTLISIVERMIQEVKRKFGENVIDYKFIRWSESIDPCLDTDADLDTVIGNPRKFPFQALMCKVEDHMKAGLKLYGFSKNYPKERALQKLRSLRYVIEEGVGLYWELYPKLYSNEHLSNSTIYFGYPSEVSAMFGFMMALIKESCRELGFKYSCPETVHLQFVNCTNDAQVILNLASAEGKKYEKEKKWTYRYLGLTQENSTHKERGLMKEQKKLYPDTLEYDNLLNVVLTQVLEEENRYLGSQLSEYRDLIRDLVDNAALPRKEEESQSYVNKILMRLYAIQEHMLLTPYGRLITSVPGWNITDYYGSVVKVLEGYVVLIKSLRRNHRTHGFSVLVEIDKLALGLVTPTILMETLLKSFVAYVISVKHIYTPSGHSEALYHCFYHLVRYHGVVICKSGLNYEVQKFDNSIVECDINQGKEEDVESFPLKSDSNPNRFFQPRSNEKCESNSNNTNSVRSTSPTTLVHQYPVATLLSYVIRKIRKVDELIYLIQTDADIMEAIQYFSLNYPNANAENHAEVFGLMRKLDKVIKCFNLLEAVRFIFNDQRKNDRGPNNPAKVIMLCREVVKKAAKLFICLPVKIAPTAHLKIQFNETSPYGGFSYESVLELERQLAAVLKPDSEFDSIILKMLSGDLIAPIVLEQRELGRSN